MSSLRVAVIGGGLAGVTAALDLADAGCEVTLVERRRRLGGLTWSVLHGGRWIDNGQHVFLRCCTAYLGLLERIGSSGDVALQPRLSVTVLRPTGGAPRRAVLARGDLAAPLHLGASLLRYGHLSWRERLAVGRAALPLRQVDLDDPALDSETFAAWLRRHGQSQRAVESLWDVVTVATVNLGAGEASAAMGAKVFQTGLLTDRAAADIGWATVPLAVLHGDRSAGALAAAGVEVRTGTAASGLAQPGGDRRWRVLLRGEDGTAPEGRLDVDRVVTALPARETATLLPPGSLPRQDELDHLGTSAIVNVHVTFDRTVTDLPLFAALGCTAHWVFDRTASSGWSGPGQYLAVTVSDADRLLGRPNAQLAEEIVGDLRRVLPDARRATVVDTFVTKERTATFRAAPGTAALRPRAATGHPGLAVAGAWTDTGWPATMEGAVRSGHAAAAAVLAGANSRGRAPAAPQVPSLLEVE